MSPCDPNSVAIPPLDGLGGGSSKHQSPLLLYRLVACTRKNTLLGSSTLACYPHSGFYTNHSCHWYPPACIPHHHSIGDLVPCRCHPAHFQERVRSCTLLQRNFLDCKRSYLGSLDRS